MRRSGTQAWRDPCWTRSTRCRPALWARTRSPERLARRRAAAHSWTTEAWTPPSSRDGGPTAATSRCRLAVVATTPAATRWTRRSGVPGVFAPSVEISLRPSAKQPLAILRVHARAAAGARRGPGAGGANSQGGTRRRPCRALPRSRHGVHPGRAPGLARRIRRTPNDGDGSRRRRLARDRAALLDRRGPSRRLVRAARRSSSQRRRGTTSAAWTTSSARLKQAVEWLPAPRGGVPAAGRAAARRAAPRPAGVREDHVARAAATASGATVIALSAADVFSKYVGEGERALRDAFARAAPRRGAGDSAPGRDRRDGRQRGAAKDGPPEGARTKTPGTTSPRAMLSAFLVEMDGLEVGGGGGDDGDDERRDGDGVLVVATTNRPNALDAARDSARPPGPGAVRSPRRARQRGGAARTRAACPCRGRGLARGRDSNRAVHRRPSSAA